jgi:sialic acid synthase SpsE
VNAPWDAERVFVIAEAGSNWRLGSPARDRRMARTLIDVAVDAGADAVKFQTYRPETVYVPNAGQSDYLAAGGIKEDISAIFADLAMPYELIPELAEYARSQGIAFMSTAFSLPDLAAVDPHVAVHKIASYEISHIRLIEQVAALGKPLCLLQCTARYPAPPEAMNLRTIPALAARFGLPVGLSDHSPDPLTAPVAAVGLGACVVEKHYTVDRRLPGPDHAFAIEPNELKAMVRAVRDAAQMRGSGEKTVLPAEAELAAYARRGVQAIRPIAAGEPLREGVNVDILRPGKQRLGVHPRHLASLEGRPARRDIPLGDGLQPDDWA